MFQASFLVLALFAVSFLLGSIPWGVIISKVFFKTDIRKHGSGNIGTTNAMRSLGKVGGGAVFVLDFAKGLFSGVVAMPFAHQVQNALVAEAVSAESFFGIIASAGAGGTEAIFNLCLAISFLGCVWGHIFSPWLGFKGGKGIAVAVGCLFMVFGPVGALLELSIFIVLVVATRYVSFGSVAAAAACPFFSLYYFWGNWASVVLCSIAAVTVVWAHRENIKRLMAGTERRIGDKKEKEAEVA